MRGILVLRVGAVNSFTALTIRDDLYIVGCSFNGCSFHHLFNAHPLNEIGVRPTRYRGCVKTSEIPPTAVCGWFRSDLQRDRLLKFEHSAHGSSTLGSIPP